MSMTFELDPVGPPETSAFDPEIAGTLRRIVDPCSIATGVPINLIDMGLVLDAARDGRTARIKLQLTSNLCMQLGNIETKIYEEVGALADIDDVAVAVDYEAEWLPSMVARGADAALRERRPFPLTVL